MNPYDLTVVVASYKTPDLLKILIRSFKKFSTKDFKLNFLIVENSDFDLSELHSEDCKIFYRQTSQKNTDAHAEALEFSKKYIETDYVFTCHSDTCVVSSTFFEELKNCIEEGVYLAGVCEDKAADRVKALHSSGLFVHTSLFKKISILPIYPKIDSADLLTVHCRENGLKTRLFRNTYNDSSFVDICNSPFRELGKECGMDRCLDSSGNVMFIHQGRGTPKYTKSYSNDKKVSLERWIEICSTILE